MAIHVPTQRDDLVTFLRKAFSDYYAFDDFLSLGLGKLIDDMLAQRIVRNRVNVKLLVDRYSSASLDKGAADQMKVLLATAYLAHLQLQPDMAALFCDQAALLAAYPSFATAADVDERELGFLLAFRNLLMVALTFVPAKGNKIFLLKVIERLEGSNNEYVTGSGQKPAVTRRVLIYETEGNVKAKRKADTEAVVIKKPCATPAPVMAPVVMAPVMAPVAATVVFSVSEQAAEQMTSSFLPLNLDLQGFPECDFQPSMGKLMTSFMYRGSVTEELLNALDDFDDANLAAWA